MLNYELIIFLITLYHVFKKEYINYLTYIIYFVLDIEILYIILMDSKTLIIHFFN
jgi:hypothetical protein